jgi:hypothetical protein
MFKMQPLRPVYLLPLFAITAYLLFVGVTHSQSDSTNSRDVNLYGINAIIVSVQLGEDYPYDKSDTIIFRSMIENQLRRNGVNVFSTWKDIYADTVFDNPIELNLSISTQTAPHQHEVLYWLTLKAGEWTEVTRYEVRNTRIPLTSSPFLIMAQIWDNGFVGTASIDSARGNCKEKLTELVDVFVNDLANQNSTQTGIWLEHLQKERDSSRLNR